MSDTKLPDGSGFFIASFPLPADHWLYANRQLANPDGPTACEAPPMPMRVGTDDPRRRVLVEQVRAAAKYAVRAATMQGSSANFDPDALVQNMIVGLLGYFTPTGLGTEPWENPPQGGAEPQPWCGVPRYEIQSQRDFINRHLGSPEAESVRDGLSYCGKCNTRRYFVDGSCEICDPSGATQPAKEES